MLFFFKKARNWNSEASATPNENPVKLGNRRSLESVRVIIGEHDTSSRVKAAPGHPPSVSVGRSIERNCLKNVKI